jgi:hypothetical protein
MDFPEKGATHRTPVAEYLARNRRTHEEVDA